MTLFCDVAPRRHGFVAAGIFGLLPCVLACTALAQPSFDLRTRFVRGWGDEATPITEPIVISATGRYDFEFQEGVFNAVGFTNYGVANWIGTIFSTEPGLTRPASPRQAPFNQIGNDGTLSADGTRIGVGTPPGRLIDVAHAWEIYHYSGPTPVPQPYGAEEFVSLYRFSIEITDLTPRDIQIIAQSTALSRPLTGWFVVQHVPPNEETGEIGFIDYRPTSLPPEYAQDAELSLGLLRIVPPLCQADWNGDGSANSQDFFDFIVDFLASDADFNHNGVTNSQDFFDFLTVFFVPC